MQRIVQHIFFLFLCSLVLVPWCPGLAGEKFLEAEHPLSFSDVGRIRRSIASSTAKLDESYQKEHSLLIEMDSLDRKISQQQQVLDALQKQIRDQEKILGAKSQEERLLSRKNDELKSYMLPRLRVFYFRSDTGFLDVLFTSRTLPDLVLMKDSFHFLVEQDRKTFLTYETSLAKIKEAKQATSLEKAIQEGQLAAIDRERQKLQRIVDEKNHLLKKVQTQKELYQIALEEMRRIEQDLTTALSQHENKEPVGENDFVLNKGSLPPPVWGEVIGRFGAADGEDEEEAEAIFNNGIILATPHPVDVIAVYEGEVVFAGFMPGYGKIVIIHHGQDYYSVTARFDEITIVEGDWVTQGQTIGTTGENSSLFGEGLYFEIRRDAALEDPLDWLQPGLPIQR